MLLLLLLVIVVEQYFIYWSISLCIHKREYYIYIHTIYNYLVIYLCFSHTELTNVYKRACIHTSFRIETRTLGLNRICARSAPARPLERELFIRTYEMPSEHHHDVEFDHPH